MGRDWRWKQFRAVTGSEFRKMHVRNELAAWPTYRPIHETERHSTARNAIFRLEGRMQNPSVLIDLGSLLSCCVRSSFRSTPNSNTNLCSWPRKSPVRKPPVLGLRNTLRCTSPHLRRRPHIDKKNNGPSENPGGSSPRGP